MGVLAVPSGTSSDKLHCPHPPLPLCGISPVPGENFPSLRVSVGKVGEARMEVMRGDRAEAFASGGCITPSARFAGTSPKRGGSIVASLVPVQIVLGLHLHQAADCAPEFGTDN